jgi:molybdopterin/thiamine biosynthesis adenylyltransferase
MNRMIGVLPNELGKLKVEYAERIARNAATSIPFDVHSFQGSVAEKDGLRYLLDADIIMNAADSHLARQVLDHASYAFEIPVVDGGTILVIENGIDKMICKSQIFVSGPGQPCLECLGVYSQQSATMARENPDDIDPRKYVLISDESENSERAPSVIAYNGLVASLMVQRMMNIVLGFPPRDKVGQQRYYIEAGILEWAPTVQCKVDCPKQSWTGLGDSHQIPVGIDPIWKLMRKS